MRGGGEKGKRTNDEREGQDIQATRLVDETPSSRMDQSEAQERAAA
jgi:hypothetical protein